MLKKFIIGLAILVVFASVGCSSGSGEGNTTSNQTLTIEDLAQKKKYSIGEINKDYRLDPKNKQSNELNMSINLIGIKSEKEKPLSETTLNNTITITNAGSLDLTKGIVSDALFFELYTEKGRKITHEIKMYVIGTSDGNSEIILNSEKFDLTMYKFLAVGPIENANEKRILFEIQP